MASALLCCPPLPPRRHRYHTRTGVRPSISQAAAYESRKIEPNITVWRGAARAENLVMVTSHGLAAAARAPARTVGATGRPRASVQSSQGQTWCFFPLSVTMSVELAGRKGRVMVRGCAMTASGRADGRRPPERLQGRLHKWRVVFRGRGSERIWHFQSVTNRLRSRKRAPDARNRTHGRSAITRSHMDRQITATDTHKQVIEKRF